MAFTTTQIEALEKAIASGVTKVKYGDEEVTYRSLNEMERVLNTMKSSLGASSNRLQVHYQGHSRG